MADDSHSNPDSEAKKWFALALIGTLLYVGTVFVFVITADPGVKHDAGKSGNQVPAEVEHGQSH
jgi:hypothetical protein